MTEAQGHHQPGQMNRRGVFRGAALLGSASLLAAAGPFRALAQPEDPAASVPPPTAGAAAGLSAQTERVLRWTGPGPADWVPPRDGVDHNVVILGGGQTGISIAYGLAREGIGKVRIIDQAEPGQAGIWRTIARMHQLRTPKTLSGPERGNAALGFRAWFETQYGPEAFNALDRIPRLTWADYLTWFQQVTGTQTQYRTRLLEVEPAGDVLKLHLETQGTQRIETTRKLILANGYMGAGGGNIPGFIRALPQRVWSHTELPIPFDTLAGRVVGVLGAGASAFDAAGTALEHGAAQVHLFSRRSFINYTNAPAGVTPTPPATPQPFPRLIPDPDHLPLIELAYGLPDDVRWRNQLLRDRPVASVPYDSLQRSVTSDRFYLHVDSSWSDVGMTGDGKVSVTAHGDTHHFDYVIAGTGYRVDMAAQPELTRVHDAIALWRDRYKPAPGEEDAEVGAYPYLGPGFQFLPRQETGAEYLRNIHCLNLAAEVSFGILVGDVASMVLQPQLISAIARDFYAEGVDVAANRRLLDAPQPPAPNPTAYQQALRA